MHCCDYDEVRSITNEASPDIVRATREHGVRQIARKVNANVFNDMPRVALSARGDKPTKVHGPIWLISS